MKKLMWGEEEHGLGINRNVASDEVLAFERAIFTAAQTSESLGVTAERFLDLCQAAVDVCQVDADEMEGRTVSSWVEYQVEGGMRLGQIASTTEEYDS